MVLPSLLAPLSVALFVSSGVYAASNSTSNTTSTSYNDTSILSSGAVSLGAWQSAYDKATAFVSALTNEEKIELITGSSIESQNFTALDFLDSSSSLYNYYFASGFPLGNAVAMTFDKDLMYSMYKASGDEHYAAGTQVMNGPVSEPLGRSPWGGRNIESFGVDAYLNGITFGIAVQAILDAGVVPGGKHFLMNEQETNREASGSLNSPSSQSVSYSADVDDKALHETYLWPFYDGTKAGMGAVMCAMNRVNESYACENSELLNNYLKTEMGFPGLVYADVSGQKTAFGSATAGLDYGSSQYWSNDTILEGISNGSLSQTRLDDMAVRNLIAWYYAGLDEKVGSQPEDTGATGYRVRGNNSQIIRDVGAASIVLLKNTDNALPLSAPQIVAIFGSHAGSAMGGPNFQFSVAGEDDVYYGHLTSPGGSGALSLTYSVSPQHALIEQARVDNTMLRWILNNTYTAGSGNALVSSGTGSAITLDGYASGADVCLVFVNAWSGEGADRTELRDSVQDELVTSVAADCNNTVVVMNTVGPRILDAWIENVNVTAVLYAGLLGQESGYSIRDVLYGDVNPSARLPYTIAKNESDYAQFTICEGEVCTYDEGNLLDYKYFDYYNMTPRYEFGYGLSYTSFTYGNATVTSSNLTSGYASGQLAVGGREDLWDDVVEVQVPIQNTGSRDGSEVAQLYVSFPSVADEPIRQLRGFEKIAITAGSTETATFTLRQRDLSYWDVTAQEWAVAAGEYGFYVGASSRDLRANTTLTVE